jgi:hypothetical protein
MGCYIDQNGNYYEGDQQGADQEVPYRPTPYHDWQGGAWVDNSAAHYRELRAAEYPPAADYLDAVVKANQVAIDAYIQKCLAVKVKYPKS